MARPTVNIHEAREMRLGRGGGRDRSGRTAGRTAGPVPTPDGAASARPVAWKSRDGAGLRRNRREPSRGLRAVILLLDAHTLLWWLADDATLGQAARGAIADPANDVLV